MCHVDGDHLLEEVALQNDIWVVKDMSAESLKSSWGDQEVMTAKKGDPQVVQPWCGMCQDHKLFSSFGRGSLWWGTVMP